MDPVPFPTWLFGLVCASLLAPLFYFLHEPSTLSASKRELLGRCRQLDHVAHWSLAYEQRHGHAPSPSFNDVPDAELPDLTGFFYPGMNSFNAGRSPESLRRELSTQADYRLAPNPAAAVVAYELPRRPGEHTVMVYLRALGVRQMPLEKYEALARESGLPSLAAKGAARL